MSDSEPLIRIASALERIAPAESLAPSWLTFPAYVWDGATARPVAALSAPPLALLRGIDDQKAKVAGNVMRFAHGHAAHDMLLWGARGMGKSALVRSAVATLQQGHTHPIALVQIAPEGLAGLPRLFALLQTVERRFIVYIDDLGFAEGDDSGPRALRSWLEGGVEARPDNVRIAVTSNRRAIVSRSMREQDDPLNPRDVVDDRLALADRFGLSIGFHVCSQDDYLAIVAGYALAHALSWDESDALEWSRRRGARSGRIAWHYVTELAGRQGKAL